MLIRPQRKPKVKRTTLPIKKSSAKYKKPGKFDLTGLFYCLLADITTSSLIANEAQYQKEKAHNQQCMNGQSDNLKNQTNYPADQQNYSGNNQ